MTGPGADRRTLYGFIDRLNLPGLYRTFDFPDPNATSPQRDQTTVAPQSLFLMNHPFAIDAARAILRRPDVAGEGDPDARLARIYRLFYGLCRRTPMKSRWPANSSPIAQGERTPGGAVRRRC